MPEAKTSILASREIKRSRRGSARIILPIVGTNFADDVWLENGCKCVVSNAMASKGRPGRWRMALRFPILVQALVRRKANRRTTDEHANCPGKVEMSPS